MPHRPGRRARVALAVALALTALCAGVAVAEPGTGRPPDEMLRVIEDRGRFVARYLGAIAKAQTVFAREGQSMPHPDGIVALEGHDGWRVVFLEEPPKDPSPGGRHRGTVIIAETQYAPDTGEVSSLLVLAPPQPAPSPIVSTVRALEVALKAVDQRLSGGAQHDAAVLREHDGTFTVYVLPKADKESDVVFGGDFAARVAVSGRQVLSVEPLHAKATAISLAGHATAQPSLHVHATDDLPTPTDVALVLLHPATAPHLILTPHSMFRLDAGGTLTYLGANPTPAAAPAAPSAPASGEKPAGPGGGS